MSKKISKFQIFKCNLVLLFHVCYVMHVTHFVSLLFQIYFFSDAFPISHIAILVLELFFH